MRGLQAEDTAAGGLEMRGLQAEDIAAGGPKIRGLPSLAVFFCVFSAFR